MFRRSSTTPGDDMQKSKRTCRGIYKPRSLPHIDMPRAVQFVTFCTRDALGELGEYILTPTCMGDEDAVGEPYATQLDEGRGRCLLAEPACAALVAESLRKFDGVRYRLVAWCVMPNHVHVVVETKPEWALAILVQGWKGWTSKAINKHLGLQGSFWQRDYFDRLIRNEVHLASTLAYVHHNPVAAGLVTCEKDWPFSSANRRL